ncbi:hypothetical protein GCM10010912_03860 [Paenibacillus albidus]|uniref:Fe/B12 periplasmic-binding domain-containing protein n=1 Tax=Paenibacillus albidus TaxID=2041023 RepID=A0A917BWS4_9BACL|nr:ABC transporter substrate-binding protein [Paenibacillus albidus]GGF61943.1 hypothetical protein GCM10010912_03860 [Paenibacillus albidus]
MEDTQYALQSIRKRRSGPSGELFSGFMETHTLWFVVSGSGDLYLDGARHPLKAKTVAYCPPGAIIDIRLAPESAAGLEVYELQVQVWELEERSGNRILFGKRLEELAPHILNEGVGLELPLDKLAEYAADYIFVSVWEENGGAEFARNVLASREWKELPAVRNGRIYPIDLELFKHNDPIAIEQQLMVQTELLTKVHKKTYYR